MQNLRPIGQILKKLWEIVLGKVGRLILTMTLIWLTWLCRAPKDPRGVDEPSAETLDGALHPAQSVGFARSCWTSAITPSFHLVRGRLSDNGTCKRWLPAMIYVQFHEVKFFSDSYEILHTVFVDQGPSFRTVWFWFSEFKRGKARLKDDPRPGRPLTVATQENVDAVERLTDQDPRITYRSIGEILGIKSVPVILPASRWYEDASKINQKSPFLKQVLVKYGEVTFLWGAIPFFPSNIWRQNFVKHITTANVKTPENLR